MTRKQPYNAQMSRYLAGMARQAPVPATPEHAVALMVASSQYAIAESINALCAVFRDALVKDEQQQAQAREVAR